MKKVLALVLILCCICASCNCALAASKAKATQTPPPVDVIAEPIDPPEGIQRMLDIAYTEWETLAGKTLKKSNKYTKWWNNYEWGWCAGFVTWCMLEAEIPMDDLDTVKANGEGPVEGLYHVKTTTPGKMLRGYQIVGRTGIVPQKGFLAVYGVRKSANRTTHVGIVYDVQALGEGKYRITTIEGNMSNRVKMYVHDYDMFAADQTKNLTVVPKEEQTEEERPAFSYKMQDKNWYLNRFLMPWLPEDETL